jgi:hypothetical protein
VFGSAGDGTNRLTDSEVTDLVLDEAWCETIETRARVCRQRLSPREQRQFRLEILPRLARRVDSFSDECCQCQHLKNELSHISQLLTHRSGLNHNERKQYLSGMAQVTRHLNRKHRLVSERHYVKRFVSLAVALGLGLVGLGYLLLYLGVTLIVLTVALPALIGRIIFSYLVGLFMDRRAKKRGRVI